MRKFILAFSALGLLAASAPSIAAPCRDAKGHFVEYARPKHGEVDQVPRRQRSLRQVRHGGCEARLARSCIVGFDRAPTLLPCRIKQGWAGAATVAPAQTEAECV